MLAALGRAFDQLGDPAIRRVVWLSVAAALAVLIALVAGIVALLGPLDLVGIGWLDWAIDLVGALAAVALAVLLFPGFAAVISSLFLDSVADAVERRWYPGLGPARPQGWVATIGGALRFLVLIVVLNLLALVLVWFIPLVNVAVFYLLNGYLLGREYFDMVALRRCDRDQVQRLRARYGARLLAAGTIVAALLTVPVLNLLVPVIATAFMTHIFHRLDRSDA